MQVKCSQGAVSSLTNNIACTRKNKNHIITPYNHSPDKDKGSVDHAVEPLDTVVGQDSRIVAWDSHKVHVEQVVDTVVLVAASQELVEVALIRK